MYSIGLDIGIASVGWSIINTETGRIDDLGVRLFTARNSDNNEVRRQNRGHRRLLRRRVTRVNDGKKILKSIGIEEDPTIRHLSPYELRVRGLDEKLTKGEIFKIVTHILKRRGISYLDEDEIDTGDGKDFKAALNKNIQKLREKTPGEIQYERLQNGGKVRSGYNKNGEYQLNIFTVRSYADELERILTKQQEFYPEISDDIIHKFVIKGIGEEAGLIYRKRPYYHGPGNKDNNSPYGRWENYSENGKPDNNIFDQLIGTDIIDELRASNLSLSAQKYNLLNDLNNLTINRENNKLSKDEKAEVIKHLMYDNVKTFSAKKLATFLNINFKDIKGWRINKSDKEQVHDLKAYRKWLEIFKEYNIDLNEIPTETIDEIAKIVTLNTELDAVEKTIELELPHIESEIKTIVLDRFRDLKVKGSNKAWHSFSLKLISILIPELLNTSEEQNTVIERLKIKPKLRDKYLELPHIPVEEVTDKIFNPTVSKSVRQTLRVLNQLIDRYGKENISFVTIEMPRDKNEDDQKKTIKEIQKKFEARKKDSEKYFLTKSKMSEKDFEYYMSNSKLAYKLQYYYEQDGKCAYSGETIKPEELLNQSTEIDHIIPLSISLDDSINNKVLVKAKANQVKGQRSPYQAFHENPKEMGRTWDEYAAWVKNRNFKKYKEKLLLYTGDIFDPENRQKFVSRNLNDTRYASREVLAAVNSFFPKNVTTVKVINGSFTHTLRKKWGESLDKTRETHHHHAVDATLCAVSPFVRVERYKYYSDSENKKYMIDTQTGEKISYQDYKKLQYYDKRNYIPKWANFIEQLIPTQLHPKIKFSHQVDRKSNRKVSDATLYSTREREEVKVKRGKEEITNETYIIDKIKDIYTEDGWKQFDKYKDHLLMKEHDPQTYEKLINIAKEYPSSVERQDQSGNVKKVKVSPFKLYCENNDIPYIQKYSRKGNGPAIKSIKFYSKKVGHHINITKDNQGNPINQTKHGKKVVLKNMNPFRTDVYYNAEKDTFELMGLRYKDLRFVEGEYGILQFHYINLKKEEKISENSEFCFSLYKNDTIKIEKDGSVIEGLYQSRNYTSINYFEMKPIDKMKWGSGQELNIFGKVSKSGQFIKGLKSGIKLTKYHTDYLGNKYFNNKEKLKNIIKD